MNVLLDMILYMCDLVTDHVLWTLMLTMYAMSQQRFKSLFCVLLLPPV
jgi:hypothetical protein